jgi:hypothetical protein
MQQVDINYWQMWKIVDIKLLHFKCSIECANVENLEKMRELKTKDEPKMLKYYDIYILR